MENSYEVDCKIDSGISNVDKEKETINSVSDSVDGNKDLKNTILADNENEAKSSKIANLLNSYCNNLNESADFIECELTNKIKTASQKPPKKDFQNSSQLNEVIVCEICKEDITILDFHNRGIHVNKCIDKQMSPASEIATPFSTNENVFILECPLCFKDFSSPELRSNHIKKCGKSKGLSLQSILKALELQEKHALERISLGLPAKPVKSLKTPKSPVNKKVLVQPKNKAESDIQLAKALSLSLKNSSQQEADINKNITSVILKPPNANQRPGKKTKKISLSTPLLVVRSDEERKKLLLEKVESILTSAIDFEESSSNFSEMDVPADKKNISVEEELKLWYLSSKASDKCLYYIEELLDWIKPSESEIGGKFFHLSQIAGHEILTQLPCDYTFNTSQENKGADVQTFAVSSASNQHSSSVIESLSSLVASSWMSDVNIHTACGTIIPAHRLLLAVRCPALKQDSDFCSGTGQTSLKWETISFNAALQFLNFIYTGSIDITKDLISDLSYLANKYDVFDLQNVLYTNNMNNTRTEPDKESLTTADNTENVVCASQEEINMDLEIVYDCINSSLQPSQTTNTQSSPLNDTIPLKHTQEAKFDFINLCKTDNDEYFSASNCSEKNILCNNVSPKNNGCTSPMIIDVNDNEKDIDNVSSEKTIACDNFSSPKRDHSISPVIFAASDSENDLNSTSDKESNECVMNSSQKSVSGPSNLNIDILDLNAVESNNSDDSVKFLQSSYVSHNISYNSPEKIRKSPLYSPDSSEINSFSHILKDTSQNSSMLYQNTHAEEIITSETSEPLINAYDKSNSSLVSCSPVSQKKSPTPDKCNKPHPDTNIEIESPITSNSQRSFSGFHSISGKENLDVDEVKSDLKFFSTDFFVNESLINKSSKIMSTTESETTDPDSISRENDNKDTFNLSFKNFSPPKNEFSALQFDDDIIQMSPVAKVAPPEILISDSDSDSKSQENVHYQTSPLPNYNINFFPKSIKSQNSNPAELPLLSFKSSQQVFSDPVDDSFHFFNPRMSSLNEDQIQTLNSPKSIKEDKTFPNKNDLQSPKRSRDIKRKHAIEVADSLQSPKTPVYNRKEQAATSSQVEQPQFRLSDSPITPLPNFKSMMTPEIKEALKKIGVKPLPRKKAVAILSHVYDETHPLVDSESNPVNKSEASEMHITKDVKVKNPQKRKQTVQNSVTKKQKENHSEDAVLASPESDDSSSENPEWSGCVPELSFSESSHDSPTKPSKGDIESIKLYIESSEELYHNVLNYIPLNLVEFHQELKKNDIKISIQKLMDFLDEQCITFTCPRNEEYKKKQTARANRFRKNMIAKQSQRTS